MHEVSEILSMSLEELDLVIGESLTGDEFGMKLVSDSEKRLIARRWFNNNLNLFRIGVCSNAVVRNTILGEGNTTRNDLLAAVADALLSLGGLGNVPVVVLSARLIHYGLDKLCMKYEQ